MHKGLRMKPAAVPARLTVTPASPGAHMSAPILRTAHLTLRPFAEGDRDKLLELYQAPGVRRFLTTGNAVPLEWMEQEIRSSQERFDAGGAGLWSVLRGEGEGDIVGFVGFRDFFDPPELHLLFGLHPEERGKGLATEMTRAACAYAFDVLGHTEVRSATDVPNTASAAVLTRLGMTLVRTTEYGEYGTAFFQMGRADFQNPVQG